MSNANKRMEGLKKRRFDPQLSLYKMDEKLIKKSVLASHDEKTENYEYMISSMEEVDSDYTQKTYAECDRVQNQLEVNLPKKNSNASFDHQGSLTNNTHIKLYSDIDLLVIEKKFDYNHPPLSPEPSSLYKGDPLQDLKNLRKNCEDILDEKYPVAAVDKSGGKSICLSGGSFYDRKIDVVICAKLLTQQYNRGFQKEHLGINLYNKLTHSTISNFPFMHNKVLAEQDAAAAKKLKPLIRLIKSIKCDADDVIKVSSYDVCALCFNLPINQFLSTNSSKTLLKNFLDFCISLESNSYLRDTLLVPNKTRKVFCDDGTKLDEFKKLILEIRDLYNGLP